MKKNGGHRIESNKTNKTKTVLYCMDRKRNKNKTTTTAWHDTTVKMIGEIEDHVRSMYVCSSYLYGNGDVMIWHDMTWHDLTYRNGIMHAYMHACNACSSSRGMKDVMVPYGYNADVYFCLFVTSGTNRTITNVTYGTTAARQVIVVINITCR